MPNQDRRLPRKIEAQLGHLVQQAPAATRTGECAIDVVTDYGRFLSLQREWSELLHATETDNVFLTHEWFRCWWEAFGADSRMCILCARDRGRLVGIAPLRIQTCRFRSLPVRKLSFMINSCSPEADFILVPPRKPTLSAMLKYLAQRGEWWNIVELRRLRDNSQTWRELPDAVRGANLSMTTRADKQTPYITIAGEWNSFIAQRGRNFRKIIRRRLNKLRRCSERICVCRLRSADQISEALQDVLDISSRSWKASRNAAITDRSGQVHFYERLSMLLGKRGWIDLWMMYYGHRPIAYEYHLNYRGVTSPIRADFDEQFADLSPGAHLEYEVLHALFDDSKRAVREYNTCADGYAYEMRWTDRIRPHSRAWIFGGGVYGSVLYAIGRLRRRHKTKERNSVRESA